MKKTTLSLLAAGCACLGLQAASQPNIIIIFADDMGIGDVSHNGGKAATPHLDRLAKEGMRFTDAHTTSSVCTPSRYGLLTGRYNWRTRLQSKVFFDVEDKPLIKKDESTLASLLKGVGYNTGMVGKWHLGIGWQMKQNYQRKEHEKGKGWNADYSKPAVTPTSNGFDYFYGIMASLDMAPYVYIENEKAVAIPDVSKGYNRVGAARSDFEADECLQIFAQKSVQFINERAKQDKPFFLYVPLTSPHTPIVPSEKWKGKSGIGTYGDFLMETDWVLGEVLQALDDNKLADNTLVMFSTDNGCSPRAKISQLKEKGHSPNGDLRGTKADLFEGGHRVPTLVRWPSTVKAGTTTDRLTSLVDVYATVADIVGVKPGVADGVDSVSFFPTLKDPTKNVRGGAIVMHSVYGDFAIRQGKWKLLFTGGSGGWSNPRKGAPDNPKWQLYDLDADLSEQNNLYESNPEKVGALHELMKDYIARGRSTPGAEQKNDVEVAFLKAKSTATGSKKTGKKGSSKKKK